MEIKKDFYVLIFECKNIKFAEETFIDKESAEIRLSEKYNLLVNNKLLKSIIREYEDGEHIVYESCGFNESYTVKKYEF